MNIENFTFIKYSQKIGRKNLVEKVDRVNCVHLPFQSTTNCVNRLDKPPPPPFFSPSPVRLN